MAGTNFVATLLGLLPSALSSVIHGIFVKHGGLSSTTFLVLLFVHARTFSSVPACSLVTRDDARGHVLTFIWAWSFFAAVFDALKLPMLLTRSYHDYAEDDDSTTPPNPVNLIAMFAACMSSYLNNNKCTLLCLVAFYVFPMLGPQCSDPGPPLPESKRMRVGSWPKKTYAFVHHSLTWGGGVKSHEDDGARKKLCLTGHPSGRSVWASGAPRRTSVATTLGSSLPVTTPVVASYIDPESPTGVYTFTPSKNPNTTDAVYKIQVLQDYLDSPPALSVPSAFEAHTARVGNAVLPSLTTTPVTPSETLFKASLYYNAFQSPSGCWHGDYSGPIFLNPGLVILWYVTRLSSDVGFFPDAEREAMKAFFFAHMQDDGGWGTHVEGPSTMFGTVMCYVALRLLGVEKEELRKSREFIMEHGSATHTSSWAKFYLCVLGLSPWTSHNSTPVEMLLLPSWFPFHPGRMWCHARMVYVPMSYLYSKRYAYSPPPGSADADLIESIKSEIYSDHASVDWEKARTSVADIDNYSPCTRLMNTAMYLLTFYESSSLVAPLRNYVRGRGLKAAEAYMEKEDLQTNYICIGPVNKVLNMLSVHSYAQDTSASSAWGRHAARVKDYFWVAEDGLKMQGYNGSQCWDTSFYAQALVESRLAGVWGETAEKIYAFLDDTQIYCTSEARDSPGYVYERPEERELCFRHVSEGGWPFSTSAHGWPISDCTGEGLKAALALSDYVKPGIEAGRVREITFDRLCKAVNVILTLQNPDGGFATYENNRGYRWYEWLNPSEVFGDIMIDYSYVECSMASLTALAEFSERYPKHRRGEVEVALKRGQRFMRSLQRPDGSWYGSWACCFCYGTWFGVEGLVSCGAGPSDSAVVKACDFLKSKQADNGGWGEDFRSCYNKSYAESGAERYGDSQGACVVNTAWALLALIKGGQGASPEVERGVKYLMDRQLPNGDWRQEGISGVFNRSCGIMYTAYRNVFPMWALGRYREFQGGKKWK